MNNFLKTVLMSIIVIFSYNCSKSGPVAGATDVGNGYAVGVVTNTSDSTHVAIIPINYNPLNNSFDDSLSGVTGSHGHFKIKVTPGKYNVITTSPDSLKNFLIRSIIIEGGKETGLGALKLDTTGSLLFTMGAPLAEDAKLYIKGTPYIAKISENRDSALFSNIPSETVLPDIILVSGNSSNVFSSNNIVDKGSRTVIAVSTEEMSSSVIDIQNSSAATTFAFDHLNNSFWIGTAGISVFDRTKSSWSKYGYYKCAAFAKGITDIEINRTGNVYVGTGEGLWKFNPSDTTFSQSISSRESVNEIKLRYADSPLEQPFAIIRGKIYSFDDTIDLPESKLICFIKNENDTILYSSTNNELYKIPLTTKIPTKLDIPLLPDTILSMASFSKNTLWAGTSEGLVSINSDTISSLNSYFSKANNKEIIKIHVMYSDEILFLASDNTIYKKSSSGIVKITGYESDIQELDKIIDISDTNDGSIFLLVNSGKLIELIE